MSHFNALPFPATNAELPELVAQGLERLNGPQKDKNNVTYELAQPLEKARYSACPSCGISFNFFRRKNNCVNCGQVVCADCLNDKWYLPKYGLKTPVACCTMCTRNLLMSIKSKRELEECSVRELRAYLQLYGLYNATTMIEKSDLIAAVYNNSPMPQINEDKYRESLPRPSSASSGQRQSQGSNGRGRSRSNDNEGVSGSWDRMFNTIGGEIGRGMDHIAEGLSNAFEARPSSAQRQHYQQPSFFQPPPPPTPPYPPQPPQQQFQFESQNRNSSQQSQQGFRSQGQSQGHSSSTSSENYGFNFSSDSGNRSAGGNTFNQPYHHSWQTQSRSQSHTHNSSHSDGPGPRGTRNESQQNQQHSSSTADVPDLRELVRSSKDIKTLSVKTLKALLVKNHIDHAGIVEKQELVQKVERLVANVKLEMEQERAAEADTEASQTHSNGPTSNISSGPDDNLCKICWDAATNVVFTPCGHLCTCLECTETIMRQERRECPICREFIRDYIRVFRA